MEIKFFLERKEIEKSEILYREELIEKRILKFKENGLVYFDYVGILSYENIAYVVMPKYIKLEKLKDEDLCKDQMKTIIKVIIKYYKNVDNVFNMLLSSEESEFSLIAIYDYLIKDYLEYGLYQSEKETLVENGNGEINWEKTIEESQAEYISKNIVYLDYYTSEHESDYENYIRKIHAYYLNKASEFFEKLDFLIDLDYPKIEFTVDDVEENTDRLSYMIEKELLEVYEERKIILLKMLQKLINREKSGAIEEVSQYGTRNFYSVWEKVCGEVLGNEYSKYKKEIAKPVWYDKANKALNVEASRLIPDILIYQKEILYIFDAKYYNPKISKEKVDGLPEMSSIGKQFLYEMAFKNIKPNIKNIFLIPSENDEIEYEGRVELEYVKNICKDIKLYSIPAEKFYLMFLENKSIFNEISEIFS